MNYQYIEWFGAFIAILGTILLAFKIADIKYTWILWCISNIALGSVFLSNGQYGLLSLQSGLFIISLLGILGLKFKGSKTILGVLYLTLFTSVILVFFSIIRNFISGFNLTLTVEWIGAFITLGANALMSTQDKHHNYAWPLWVIGNFLLIGLSIYNQQMGFLALQTAFLIFNVIGLYKHCIKGKTQTDLVSV